MIAIKDGHFIIPEDALDHLIPVLEEKTPFKSLCPKECRIYQELTDLLWNVYYEDLEHECISLSGKENRDLHGMDTRGTLYVLINGREYQCSIRDGINDGSHIEEFTV